MVVNKRGQLSLPQILGLLVIILVIIVILVLAFGGDMRFFNSATGGLRPVAVDTVALSCNTHCTQNSKYSYCNEKQVVEIGDVKSKPMTCKELAESEEYSSYGFNTCSSLC